MHGQELHNFRKSAGNRCEVIDGSCVSSKLPLMRTIKKSSGLEYKHHHFHNIGHECYPIANTDDRHL